MREQFPTTCVITSAVFVGWVLNPPLQLNLFTECCSRIFAAANDTHNRLGGDSVSASAIRAISPHRSEQRRTPAVHDYKNNRS